MYKKELYFILNEGTKKGCVRNYTENDLDDLITIQKESFPPPFPSELWWNKEQLMSHITRFPEGALCVEVEGELAGSITGLRVNVNDNEEHSWEEITDRGYIGNHDPKGSTLYIVDICIRPSYRGLQLGKWLMQSMYEVVVHHRIERLLGGGRMPGYHKFSETLSPKAYLEKVLQGSVFDPVITFLLKTGRTPVGIMKNYLEDEESLNHAVLMEWKNPFLN